MERKKVLWLCSWYPNRVSPFDGDFIQRHARAAALFHDIHVIHLVQVGEGPARVTEEQSAGGLTEQIVYYRNSSGLAGYFRWLLLYKQAIRNFIVRNGKPALVHVQVPMKAGILALWLRRRYKIPYVVTEHWGIYNTVVEDNIGKRSRLFRSFLRRILRQSSAFIPVSQYLGEAVNRMLLSKPFTVIPNTVDISRFHYRPREKQGFRFIHVSNMVPLKNPEGILRAFAAFILTSGQAELWMVGDREPGIRAYAATLGIPTGMLRFCGEIPYTAVAEEMKNADALILFSQIENAPCVIGEALCCGLPVIATAVGGIPELVDPGNSILLEPGDEKALTASMHKMVAQYPQYNRPAIAAHAAARFSYTAAGGMLDRQYAALWT